MPKRRRTRAQNRASYIAAERRQNQRVRLRNVEERLPIFANEEPPSFYASGKAWMNKLASKPTTPARVPLHVNVI